MAHSGQFTASFLVVVLLISAVGPAVGAAAAPPAQTETVSVIVEFEDTDARDPSVIQSRGGTVTGGEGVTLTPVLFAQLPTPAIDAIEQQPGVVSVTRDTEVNPVTQTVGWNIQQIKAERALSTIPESDQAQVQVAVIDTGIDYTHPDLDSNVAWGANTVNETTGKAAAMDENGHGTAVAGIVAAENNQIGVLGVAPAVELYGIKALGKSGSGQTSDLIEALDLAVQGPDGEVGTADDADVISLSIGTNSNSPALQTAIDQVSEHALVVAAAGNDGDGDADTDNVTYPAKYSSTIAVGATDPKGEVSIWSSDGDAVDIVAPGAGVPSTTLDDAYATHAGTSYATPHVAGAAALILAADHTNTSEDLSQSEVRDRLLSSAVDIRSSGVDRWSGHGRLQIESSVHDLLPNDTAPSVKIAAPEANTQVSDEVPIKIAANDDEDVPEELAVSVQINSKSPKPATYSTASDEFIYEWDTRDFAEDHSHTITAIVQDTAGHTVTTTRTVTVNNEESRPQVHILTPEEGKVVQDTVTVRAWASDAEDATRELTTHLSINNSSSKPMYYASNSGEFRIEWDTTTAPEDTNQTLTVRVQDSAGKTATASRTVYVDNVNSPPNVSIDSPDEPVSGSVDFEIHAIDDRLDGHELDVRYRVDDGSWSQVAYNSTTNIYHASVSTASLSEGDHTFEAAVSDGNSVVKKSRTFTVANAKLAISSLLSVKAENVTTAPDSEAEVTFKISNTGDEETPIGLRLNLPANWAVSERPSQGLWSDRRLTLFYQEPIASGATLTAPFTVTIPPNERPGTYTIGATVIDSRDQIAGTSVNATIQANNQTLQQLAGQDNRFQFGEVLRVISYYNTGEAVPNTDGGTVTFEQVLHAIELYNENRSR